MSDIQVVKRQAISFGAQGQAASSEEAYIKIVTTFRRNGTLRNLQGSPLSAFLDVALAEAEEPPGVTMKQIEEDTGVSYRQLLRIMPRLCDDRFCTIAGHDQDGNQIYRVAAYAWFGNANKSTPSPRGSNTRRNNPTERGSNTPEQLPLVGGSNTNAQLGTASNSPRKNARSCDKMSHAKMSYANGVPNNNNSTNSISILKEIDEQTLLLNVGIFRKLHVNEPVRSKLAHAVPHKIAERWAQWVPLAPLDPYYKPVGYMVKVLTNDPQAEPPDLDALLRAEHEKREQAEREAEYARKLAAGEIEEKRTNTQDGAERIANEPRRTRAADIWKATLGELQLQMTQATFDTWVKPTFAISYDDEIAQMVVGVRNAYAKQWLVNRLYGMVERTMNHVVGKPVEILFQLKTRDDE